MYGERSVRTRGSLTSTGKACNGESESRETHRRVDLKCSWMGRLVK